MKTVFWNSDQIHVEKITRDEEFLCVALNRAEGFLHQRCCQSWSRSGSRESIKHFKKGIPGETVMLKESATGTQSGTGVLHLQWTGRWEYGCMGQ